MLSIPHTMAAQAAAAAAKCASRSEPVRYAVSAMLGGAYVGVGVVLMVCAAGPFFVAASPVTKLVSGAVFSVALCLVVFAGGELATSNMMTLPQGVVARSITLRHGTLTLLACLAGNLGGAMLFSAIVAATGVVTPSTAAGRMLASMVEAKAHESALQLFTRGVLCNFLVCLAMWMCARVSSETAKIALIFMAILAFVTSGFEHVVANMTTFTLALFSPGVTSWGQFARNVVWVGTGNLVGGMVLVGLAYALVAGPVRHAAQTRD